MENYPRKSHLNCIRSIIKIMINLYLEARRLFIKAQPVGSEKQTPSSRLLSVGFTGTQYTYVRTYEHKLVMRVFSLLDTYVRTYGHGEYSKHWLFT